MEPSEAMFRFVSRFAKVPEEEMKHVTPYLQVRVFNKKTVVLNQGETERYFNFVAEGLVRKYVIHNKKEINLYFATEGEIMNSVRSFIKQVPSDIILEALEPTTLISISYENLEEIYGNAPFFERVGRLVMADQLIKKDEWEINRIKQTVRERFIGFVKENPDLVQRVPQKMLASYLNMEPETFSRLKHLLMKN